MWGNLWTKVLEAVALMFSYMQRKQKPQVARLEVTVPGHRTRPRASRQADRERGLRIFPLKQEQRFLTKGRADQWANYMGRRI